MIQVDSLRNSVNQQGLSRASFDSSDSNSSVVSSPGSVSYIPAPGVPPILEKGGSNILMPWTHSGPAFTTGGEDSDDNDEYRPFTPPPPRERLSYTRYQLELLSAIYNQVKYPNSTQKQLIAKRVGITRDQVKIWFQNRRRKDVVGRQDKAPESKDGVEQGKSDGDDSANKEDKSSDSSEGSSEKPIDEQVLPPLVMKSVLAELARFENDPLKNKKNKKKSRKRPAPSQAVGPKPPQPMFHSYDMISPPNKVTPSAFLNTVPNRFNHSKNTSAFHNPRNGRISGQMMLAGHPSYLAGMTHPPSASNIGILPNDYANPPNTTAPPSHSLYDSIPVLADLLGYRTHVDPSRSRNHSLPQSHLSPPGSTLPGRPTESAIPDTSANSLHSAMALNRVFPFPFIADPPVMLSSIRHTDPYRPQLHYQPPSYPEDPYQPLVISSLSNPYFSSPASTSWASPPQPDTNVTGHTAYTQL